MRPLWIATIALIALPIPAMAARYRIDPQPKQDVLSVFFTETLAETVASSRLDLLNFVVDTAREAVEGVDFPKYNRKRHFGPWRKPVQGSCYNTRAQVLIRDSQRPVDFSEGNKCQVESGVWFDHYSGDTFTQAQDIQVDHVVALKNAYISGAWDWGARERCHFANFIGNEYHLVAVSGRENMRKSDKTPAEYLPPNRAAVCEYLRDWLSIKAIWDLTLGEEETLALRQAITDHRCGITFQTVTPSELRRQRQMANQAIEACQHLKH